MPRPRKKRQAHPDQLVLEGLFEIPRAPAPRAGSLDYATEMRLAISRAIRESSKDRDEIAMEMSRLTGKPISKAKLDAWTAESKEGHRFPFEFAAAFEEVTSSTSLQELLAQKRGSTVLVGEEVLLAKMGQLDRIEQQAREEKRKLKKKLGIG
ncbi:MAG: hypothetical protein HQL52_03790 [Magnetococcales bacterium]|nr:hypothetical protein [Magnetococcales bacterium]